MTADFWGLPTAGGTATAYGLLAGALEDDPNLEVRISTFVLCTLITTSHVLHPPSKIGSCMHQLPFASLCHFTTCQLCPCVLAVAAQPGGAHSCARAAR